jgi:type II secretory pathway predicted ATPase ExeA
VSIQDLAGYYGFSKTPFGKNLAPSMLHRYDQHNEAVARITWCINEQAFGIITGEVGVGKTVAIRAALAGLDPSRHTIIYLPNPATGTRGIYVGIITKLGATPRFYKAEMINQTIELLAAEENERGRSVVLICDEAHLLNTEQLEELRLLTNSEMDSQSIHLPPGRTTHPATKNQTRDLRRSRPTHRIALRDDRDERQGNQNLCVPSPQTRRTFRHVVQRRRDQPNPPSQQRPAPSGEQPSYPILDRRLRQ